MSNFFACILTTCHTTFSVIPSPHTVPERHTHRKNLPVLILAAVNHSSRNCFTQSGTGTVRTWPPFPTRSTIAQRFLTTLQVIETEIGQFPSSKTTTQQHGDDRPVSLALERRRPA